MNIKTIIVGTLAVGLAIGGFILLKNQKDKQAVYTPRVAMIGGQAGYAEYIHMLKADPSTGLIDQNLVDQARNEVFARGKMNQKALLGLNWVQMGPDNVGGRTRAILVDKFNPNTVYAGSVAGGLFVSYDATGTWTPVTGLQGTLGENLIISSIAQTDNGRIFFGTGCTFEGATGPFIGNGVYEYVPSTGQILPVLVNSGSVPNNNTSAQLNYINAMAARGNRLYLGTVDGMIWADPNTSGIYPTTYNGWTNPIEVIPGTPEQGTVHDIDIASDGSMLVCFSNKIYTAPNDQLGSFVRKSFTGVGRISGAIAPSNPNVMYLLKSNSVLIGLDISLNKGATWDEIVPGGSGCQDPFRQNSCASQNAQGGYDDAIAVDPSDWGHILVGGVQLFEWRYAPSSNPIGGSWLKAANLFESSTNPYYVHADKHTIVWPTGSTVYIGCDGGVFKSSNGGATWQERNLGYNVTTFYDVATAANGWILGGAQDNGTQLFSFGTFGSTTPLGTYEVTGGDGFDCAFSNFAGGIVYSTSQNMSLYRSNGGVPGTFYSPELAALEATGNEAFHTVIENWESGDDPLSVDSIKILIDTSGYFNAAGDTIFPGDTIFAGDTIHYASLTNSTPLYHIPTSNIIVGMPADSFNLVDYLQNKFVVRTSQGIFLTRDAARLNAFEDKWFKISSSPSLNNAENFEFSADGNHLFVGTSGGQIWRISGLSMANDSIGLDTRSGSAVVTQTLIATGLNGVVNIAADANNSNYMIATVSGYSNSNHVYRCTNALTASTSTGNFIQIQGSGGNALPKMPVYCVEIDYNNKDKVIIGTDWGVWTSDNAFSAASGAQVVWTDESGTPMAHVPVYAIEQQRSRYAVNSGYVYLGTHGRGFYQAGDLFTSVNENNFDDKKVKSFSTNLSVYPNPINNAGTISFDLNEKVNTKINIYNLSGSFVKTIDLGFKTEGNHKVKFDVSSLSTGSYVISLQAGKNRSVAKFIVTR